MTDRINALTVVLERDIRDDDVEPLVAAIRMLRGVLSVQTHIADGVEALVAEQRVTIRIREALWEALK